MNFKTKVIVGTQWGDEGKGKITDYFSQEADMVVRYQGGNNAGHTIIFDNRKFFLNHIPSGIFNPKTVNVLAQGMVINPIDLMNEIINLQKHIKNFQLFISDKAHVILPYHKDVDKEIENLKQSISPKNAIGTTLKGIGPCYEDKAARIGIRFGEFIDKRVFSKRLENALLIKNPFLSSLKLKAYTSKQIVNEYEKARKFLEPFVTETGFLIDEAVHQKKDVVFESAQGSLLSLENGTYPYVTSSCPDASSIFLNIGTNTFSLQRIIGVVKAYTTRVGEGALPSEIQNKKISKHIQVKGHEYGTVTQRPRRIGWLDTVVLNHSIRVSGFNELILTLLDVLDEVDKIKIAHAYELKGRLLKHFPSTSEELSKCKVKYIEVPGWKKDTTNVKSWKDLPLNAKRYIETIEKLTNRKVTYFSVGPNREQTIKIVK